MSKYTVIKKFIDLKDSNHLYHVGDSFPRKGVNIDKKRIEELSGSDNKQHTPLIKVASSQFLTNTEVADISQPDNSNAANDQEEKPKTSRKRRK
jgi:hypothetical protein